MSERVVTGFCDDNCRFEVYTKEEMISLLEYVIANNALPEGIINGGSVTSTLAAVNAVVEQNKGVPLKFFVGTQAEWDAYTGDKTNMHPILSDDQTIQTLINKTDTLQQTVNSLNNSVQSIFDGALSETIVKQASMETYPIKLSDYGVSKGDVIEIYYMYSLYDFPNSDDFSTCGAILSTKFKIHFENARYGNVLYIPLTVYGRDGHIDTYVTLTYTNATGELVINEPADGRVVLISINKIIE